MLRILLPVRRIGFQLKWIAHLSTGFAHARPHRLWKTHGAVVTNALARAEQNIVTA
jgi:hypothetical protein